MKKVKTIFSVFACAVLLGFLGTASLNTLAAQSTTESYPANLCKEDEVVITCSNDCADYVENQNYRLVQGDTVYCKKIVVGADPELSDIDSMKNLQAALDEMEIPTPILFGGMAVVAIGITGLIWLVVRRYKQTT